MSTTEEQLKNLEDLKALEPTEALAQRIGWETHEIDLLKNRDISQRLTAFDGRVGATMTINAIPYFVVSNASYVPAIPLRVENEICLRTDLRYGTDDPTLWPQEFTDDFCHLAVIPRKPKPSNLRKLPSYACMWTNPQPSDFIPSSISRALGKLSTSLFSPLSICVHDLLDKCAEYKKTLANPAQVHGLFPAAEQAIRLGLERLSTLPCTFSQMVLEVTMLQRNFLELMGLHRYMSTYKERIANSLEKPQGGFPDDCVGAYTLDPIVAQKLRQANIPYWFLRPLFSFDKENILEVVVPLDPAEHLELERSPEYQPLPTGPSTVDRMRTLHACARRKTWYKSPFVSSSLPTITSAPPAPSATTAAASVASTSTSIVAQTPGVGVGPTRQEPLRKQQRQTPYPPQKPKGKGKGGAATPQNQNRDKFQPLDTEEMPPSIKSWAWALSSVDVTVTPTIRDKSDKYYVVPEPALLVSAKEPARRQQMVHHWTMLRDAVLYGLGHPEVEHRPLSSQAWRDTLRGLMTSEGHEGKRVGGRISETHKVLGPALEACGMDQFTDFPVPMEQVPPIMNHRMKEILWDLAETSFRFELLALDS
ncbi:hypothetical protein C8J57DRAFT_1520355 [Mycena rebaudengoi]|nr:hypothetical protein C8J57DRAFT_1520355 [Mycena rebaudengoi]